MLRLWVGKEPIIKDLIMLLYLLGIICPPLGILLYGRILHASLNAAVWGYALMTPDLMGLVLWFAAASHAAYIINNSRVIRTLDRDISF